MLKRYDAAYLWDGETLYPDGSLVIDETAGRIVDAGDRARLLRDYGPLPAIGWSHHLVMPGTVNLHAHSFQHLVRGRGVDQPFLAWRDDALYRISPRLDPEAVYLGAALAFMDMLKSGITTVADFFYVHGDGLDNDRAVIQAARDTGIRLVFARTFYDWDGAPAAYRESIEDAVSRTRRLAAEVQGDPRVTVHPAPHSLHGASDAMIQAAVRLAEELDTPFHIHVAEEPFEVDEVRARTGLTPVAQLAHLGALSERTIAVHLVWLTPDDITRLGDAGASWAYCPSSNMFLADGIAPWTGLRQAGVPAGLGTDGGCSNNRSSIFEEMRMAALLHKVANLDATRVDWRTVLDMGTRAGADILRLPAGRIAPGRLADFIAVDLTHVSLTPWTPDTLMANLVYAMQPDAVTHVVVGGRPVVEAGRWLTLSWSSLQADVTRWVRQWS
ncbi:hypothetical protein TPY_0091 [Sulfobacillus acidophilus TPY]|uniref:S-adenosylhomocysteine deaminase n=1 Tax=Sulfobacillus acidophilus (strain ATCC 700253 / DSM 10332 / NAL) TaxID=679936 RepID=G8TVL6_SULAD|nr:hypothetical protein TPY_0091 [Sulfobacillus acidophilus TPY]AEW03655.1 S-adenosylhomocysteine deaminase [Sulfobacillus acidophilus DSM 10332]